MLNLTKAGKAGQASLPVKKIRALSQARMLDTTTISLQHVILIRQTERSSFLSVGSKLLFHFLFNNFCEK
jgi:hypothetical protein